MASDLNQYYFGNSLVNYSPGGDDANILVWMDQFVEAAGFAYTASGEFGFLRDYADNPEPSSTWGFSGVDPSYDPDVQSFSASDIDNVVITPANFIQDQSPTTNYAGDTRSPVDATLDVISDVQADQPDATIYIYQGWPDLGPFSQTVPPSDAQFDAYIDYAQGSYAAWFDSYIAELEAGAPTADIQIIPVSDVLMSLVDEGGPLADVPFEDLFVDSAPHGTDTVYFLAAMINYSTVFGEPVSDFGTVPDTIIPEVADNLSAIASFIDAEVQSIVGDGTLPGDPGTDVPTDPTPDPTPDPDPDPTPDPDPDPEEDVPDPSPDIRLPKENVAPITADDAASAQAPNAVFIDVLANDRDDNGDALTLSSTSQPDNGTVQIVGNLALYSPADGFSGEDTFTYTVIDGVGAQSTATVTVAVEAAPGPVTPDPVTPDTPGFTAAYFNLDGPVSALSDVDFSAAPDATGTVTELAYTEETDAFWTGGPTDAFAAQYTGTLTIEQGGSYRFDLLADDFASLRIDGQEILTNQTGDMDTLQSLWLNLDAGNYEIEIDYVENTGEQTLLVQWLGPDTGDQLVPLSPDNAAATPDASAAAPEPDLPDESVADADDASDTVIDTPEADEPVSDDVETEEAANVETPIDESSPEDSPSEDSLAEEASEPGEAQPSYSQTLDISDTSIYRFDLVTDGPTTVTVGDYEIFSTEGAFEGFGAVVLTEGAQDLDIRVEGDDVSVSLTGSNYLTGADLLRFETGEGGDAEAEALEALFAGGPDDAEADVAAAAEDERQEREDENEDILI